MKDICVVIQTYNEEKNIAECIKSAHQLTDAILVVDTESTDNTITTAKQLGVSIQTFPFSRYVEPAREFGVTNAQAEWVLLLDADERITPELVSEIRSAIQSTEYTHYKIPRKEYFAKKIWMKHGGLWPNHQIRLINTRAFKTWPKAIHSTPEIQGNLGYLKEAILHFSKNDYAEIVKKTTVFEDVESQLLFEAGRPVSVPILFRKFFGELFRRLIKKQGYRDGTIGIIEAFYQAYSKTITYIYLYEKKNCRSVQSVS